MVIFDLDGTLWETAEATLKAANEIAKEHNLPTFKIETINKGMGYSKEDVAKLYMPDLDIKEAMHYIDLIAQKNISLINKDNVKIYNGVKEAIKSLSKQYKLGIVTNNNTKYAEKFLEVSGLKECFTDYLGAIDINASKGKAIKLVCQRNNEKNNYYVGDIKNDMLASIEAGVTFIHARYGFGKDLNTKYYINDIKELEKVLKEMK